MSDIREQERIKTLPSDLKDIANQMLEEKFGLAKQGDVVKEKPPEEGTYGYTRHPFQDPTILDQIKEGYHKARLQGFTPDKLFINPPTHAALMRDPRIREMLRYQVREDGNEIMGMKITVARELLDNRVVLVEDRYGRIAYDNMSSAWQQDTRW